MGNDNLLSYFPQADLERFEDEDMIRLVQMSFGLSRRFTMDT
jgi:hypothetical protein